MPVVRLGNIRSLALAMLVLMSLGGCAEERAREPDRSPPRNSAPPIVETRAVIVDERPPADCDDDHRTPPKLNPVDISRLEEVLWSQVQLRGCILEGQEDVGDMSFHVNYLHRADDCNQQGAKWYSDDGRFAAYDVWSTAVYCWGRGRTVDLYSVRSWGTDSTGALHFLDRSGKIELVARPAVTQDPVVRCIRLLPEYPRSNVEAQCRRASRGGYLGRLGVASGCTEISDTWPNTIELLPPTEYVQACGSPEPLTRPKLTRSPFEWAMSHLNEYLPSL